MDQLYTGFSYDPHLAILMSWISLGLFIIPALVLAFELELMDLGVSLPWFGRWQHLWHPNLP